MKKIILFALAMTMAAAWPTSLRAADDCSCAVGDVTCINNCTLSKITALRNNIQSQKAAAQAKIQAAKANTAAASEDKSADAKSSRS